MTQILVTNDDGIASPGLHAVAKAMATVGETTVLAPDHNWSAAGHNKTMHKPLRIDQVSLPDGAPAYVSSGSPSDCVALAVLGFMSPPPNLVVSGINLGANLGLDIHYSGTVAAAREGAISGVPAIAASMDGDHDSDFDGAARYLAHLARNVRERGMPPGILLNVNLPEISDDAFPPVEITRLGHRVYDDALVERQDPRGRTYYWIGGGRRSGISAEETDVWALGQNRISITPLQLDLTAHALVEDLADWDLAPR
ncbi:MAG: 5'/3'-nucleotidase SurE [Anaerolineae bacterium]